MTSERCLSDPYFWQTFFGLFCDEKKVEEFAEVSGIPASHIRAARQNYFREMSAHIHTGTQTIH
jgi:hypothetical protein